VITWGDIQKQRLSRRFLFPVVRTVSPGFPMLCGVGVELRVAQLPSLARPGPGSPPPGRTILAISPVLAVQTATQVYRGPMDDPTTRLLDAWRRRQSDHGAIAIREMIAIAAVGIVILAAVVALLHVAGFDVGGWLGEQFGVTSSG